MIRKTTAAIAMLMILSFAVSIVALPTANAQGTMDTYAFIGATPNPIGVNQETLLHVGITHQLASVGERWLGLTVTVTKPDGTTETISNINTDSTGGTGVVYVPTMAGNYTLQTHFPEQKIRLSATGTPANTTMLASDSDKLTLVVQQEPIPIYPGVPLPTEYWTRPINAQFREWYTIAGSSWEDNEYNAAPDTPHILWTKPLTMGGLVGGQLGLVGSGGTSVAMENGDAYEGKWSNRIILMGRLYYTAGAYDRPVLIHCVDLRTGEEIWDKTFLNNLTISQGQLFYWQSYNYQGTFAHLWVTSGTTWQGFDAFTGNWICNITGVPSGTNIIGPKGEIYRYTVSQSGGFMQLWNMSALVSMAGSYGSSLQLQSNLNASATVNSSTTVLTARAQRAWAWNITIPKSLPGSVRGVKLGDKVVGSNINTTDINIWAFSLKPGQEGQLLYNADWKTPAEWTQGNISFQTYGSSWAATDLDENIALIWIKEQRAHYAFSLETGQYLWKTETQHYLDIYSIGRRIYDGKLYSVGQAGIVYCYDLTTGKTLWTYNVKDPYSAEILWSDNWPEDILFAQGGKLYLFHSEHSVNQPMPRGAPAVCLNATTGEVIWRVNGLFRKTDWGGGPIMGDSVIAMYNTYDQQVYAIGKGPSATTVSIQNDVITHGSSVLVKGIVTDVSPGTEQTAVTLRFPNGVPAVSDASVGEWMKYVYVQFPRPTDTVGVEVVLSVLDPNNNYYEVGRATSDASGFFSYAFTPEVPGKYTVFASFAGSGAYYGSYAETAVNVEEAPAATPEPTPTPASVADMYFVPATAGIIVAIAAVGVIMMLMLRKRP